jgi:hypothetical protein
MSLTKTMSTLGHYAKKGLKAVTRPVNLLIAGVALSTLLSFQEAQAQTDDGDQYANGLILTKNADNNSPVEDATITLKPLEMAMYVPDTTYTFISNNNGLIEYENVLVYKDSTTGIQNYIQDNTLVFPNNGSDINVFLPQNSKGVLQYISINGQLVKEKEFSGDNVHMDLSGISPGMGVYRVLLEDGTAITGKYVKMNVPSKGPTSRPVESASLKSSQMLYEATYWMKWEREGFYTDSVQIVLHDGENDPIFAYMTPIPPPPPIDNQDLAGFVLDLNNNYAAIANATVEAYIISNGQTISTTTASDGSFTIEGVPLGEDIYFSAGGIAGKGAVVDFPYTTPTEITNPADSVWSFFDVILPDDPSASTTWAHVVDQNVQGNNQDTLWFYLGTSFNQTQKNTIRNYFIQFQADENNSYVFAEKFTQSNVGMNIEYGTYNTNTSEETTPTPLGNNLYPVIYATSTMGVGSYVTFVHEVKRALGFDGVGWYSVMRNDAPDYTEEDKDIARDVSAKYWRATYIDGKTYIPLNYFQDDMSKSYSSTGNITPVKDVKARIDELKEIADEKAKDNPENYFNFSTSFGDVEFNYVNK